MMEDNKDLTVQESEETAFEEQTIVNESDETAVEESAPVQKKSKVGNIIFFSVAGLIIAMLLTFIVLNRYVFFRVNIIGSSMYPTLESGQVLTANSKAGIEHGDIVIIQNQKEDDTLIIKRVIALGGDYIEIRNDRKVYVNGQEIDEPYVKEQKSTDPLDGAYLSQLEDLHGGMGRVPKGYVFYLGDNRENSADSRKYGLCKEEDVIGVVDEFAMFFHKLTSILY